MNDMERRDDDADASVQAQENLDRVTARLEAMIEREVAAAMADGDGASGEYRTKEQRWNAAANDVRNVIQLMRQSLEENDGTAQRLQNKAKPTEPS
ncbi:hypothetical protein [Myceligenerans pegani]|uniref:hypothetical protein n=1 Tax=Myceligenerans pegani TaxID=2776917 RepID=UPI0038CBFF4A